MTGFELWMLTAGANAVMVAIFGLMAAIMLRSLWEGHQWTTNPILLATAAVFVTCTVGHGVHLVHALEPTVAPWLAPVITLDTSIGEATRVSFSDPMLLGWDVLTAAIAITFWVLRSRLEYLVHGHALNEDMAARQRQAMELHDNIVQGLSVAKLALDQGRRAEGEDALEKALVDAKGMITGLMGGEVGHPVRLRAGDLRRQDRGS